jgi:uncharacterized protein YciW
MSLAATASAVIFPTLLWGVYHHYRDRRRPEPLPSSSAATALKRCSAWRRNKRPNTGTEYSEGLRPLLAQREPGAWLPEA